MARPAAKPALTKAPTRPHPVAPADTTTTEPEASAPRNRQRSGSVAISQSATVPTTPLPNASAAAVAEERRVMHSARIPESLRRRVKLYAAETDLTVEEITEAALSEYLERNRP